MTREDGPLGEERKTYKDEDNCSKWIELAVSQFTKVCQESSSKMKLLGTLLLSGLAMAASQPNILFILTDDQDKHMGSPDYMPQLQVCQRNHAVSVRC